MQRFNCVINFLIIWWSCDLVKKIWRLKSYKAMKWFPVISVYLMLEEIYASLKLKNHCLWWIRQLYQILTISTDFNHLFPLNHLKFSLLAFSIIGDWFCVEYSKKYSLHVHWHLCVPYLPANIVSFILSVFYIECKEKVQSQRNYGSEVKLGWFAC